MLKLVFLLCLILTCSSAQSITPDQLQFYLNMSGEGSNRQIHKNYLQSIEMSWQIHTPYHRHLFIASGLDLLSTIKSFNDVKKSDSRGRRILSAHMGTKRQLLAARSLQTAKIIINSVDDKEIDYMFKRFPYYEYEWTQQNNPYRSYSVKDRKSFLALMVGGVFFNGLIPERHITSKLIDTKLFSKWRNPKYSEAELKDFKVKKLRHLQRQVHVVFHELLPFLERWGVLVEKTNDDYEAIAFKKAVKDNTRKSLIILAQAMPEILFRAIGKQMPQWMYKVSQSFYITQLGRMALGSQGLVATLAASSIQLFRGSLEKTHKLSLDSAATTLETKIKDSFLEWRKSGMPKISGAAKLAGVKLALKAVAIGSLTWVAVDFVIKAGTALVQGQQKSEAKVAGQKYRFSARNQRMQISGNRWIDEGRSRSYAFEDAMADYQENLLTNVTGVAVSVGTFTVGSPLVLGAAAAVGLPTAGVGGAVVAASGYVIVGTAALYAANSATNAVRPLQKNFNKVLNAGEIESKLRVISTKLDNKLDSETFKARAQDLKNHYLNGHPLRFMSFSNNPSEIKTIKNESGLWEFEQMHSNGNFMRAVNLNLLNAFNKDSKTRLEAHVRYDFLDRKGDHWAWDEYSNKIVKVGLMRLNHHSIEFVGKSGFKLNFENGLLKANRSDSDLRVLSNGILMVKDAKTDQWMIRGNVSNTDIYLRTKKPGRYVWDKSKNGFVKVLTGENLGSADSTGGSLRISAKNQTSSQGQSLTSGSKGEFFEGFEN